MGYFRSSSRMIPTPEHIRKKRTVKSGEWYLEIYPCDSCINFLARNNLYSEWLWTVGKHGYFFNLVFGDFVNRLSRAKKKYQKWIDKKNSDFIHAEQVSTIIQ